MTYKEAIEILNDIYSGTQTNMLKTDNPNLANLWLRDCQALRIAIGSIEKQIPEKPDYYFNSFADGNPVWEGSCPNCGRDIEESDHHCICGQLIDWSDEE